MRLVFDDSENVIPWVANRIPFVSDRGFGKAKAIGVVGMDGRALAGVVFHDYQPGFSTIAFSIAAASPRWATKRIVAGILAYPFEQLNVQKLWTATPSSNERALKTCWGLGFSKEATLGRHFGKDHAIISRMFARDYRRMYGELNGQAKRA